MVGRPVRPVPKTLLYRLFGFGKIPNAMRPILESEGIALIEEGIGGSVTLRNFRAPGRWHSYKRSWFTGALVVTGLRFAAFQFSKPLINVPLDDARLGALKGSVEKESILRIDFDASVFQDNATGSVECRFRTPQARLFLERLERQTR